MSTHLRVALLFAVANLAPRSAWAEAPPVSVAASVGWAAPLGSAERGARLRDTTFGTVPLELDASYRLLPALGIAVRAHYAVGVPTLCQTAGDCTSSLGTDVEAVVGVRWHVPSVGPMTPLLDLGLGYEWFTARLADAGAHSARGYQGPVLLSAALAAPFRIGRYWTLGPLVGLSAGTFVTESLETDVGSSSHAVPALAVHAWLQLGLRVEFSPTSKLVH